MTNLDFTKGKLLGKNNVYTNTVKYRISAISNVPEAPFKIEASSIAPTNFSHVTKSECFESKEDARLAAEIALYMTELTYEKWINTFRFIKAGLNSTM